VALSWLPWKLCCVVHFNIAETARRLGVRRQSVYYRLEQLTGMLGDLEAPYRRTSLVVALELLKT
jgi:purine catabolism regulator